MIYNCVFYSNAAFMVTKINLHVYASLKLVIKWMGIIIRKYMILRLGLGKPGKYTFFCYKYHFNVFCFYNDSE